MRAVLGPPDLRDEKAFLAVYIPSLFPRVPIGAVVCLVVSQNYRTFFLTTRALDMPHFFGFHQTAAKSPATPLFGRNNFPRHEKITAMIRKKIRGTIFPGIFFLPHASQTEIRIMDGCYRIYRLSQAFGLGLFLRKFA